MAYYFWRGGLFAGASILWVNSLIRLGKSCYKKKLAKEKKARSKEMIRKGPWESAKSTTLYSLARGVGTGRRRGDILINSGKEES